jgi:hypothetical protein
MSGNTEMQVVIFNSQSNVPTEMTVTQVVKVKNNATDAYDTIRFAVAISVLNKDDEPVPMLVGELFIPVGEFSVKFSAPVFTTDNEELEKRLGMAAKVITEVKLDNNGRPIMGTEWLPGTLMLNNDGPTCMKSNPGEMQNFLVKSSSVAKSEGSNVNDSTSVFYVALFLMALPEPEPEPVIYRSGLRSIGGGVTRGGGGVTRGGGGVIEDGFITRGSLNTKVYQKSDYKPFGGVRINRPFKLLVAKPEENIFENAHRAFNPVQDLGYNP